MYERGAISDANEECCLSRGNFCIKSTTEDDDISDDLFGRLKFTTRITLFHSTNSLNVKNNTQKQHTKISVPEFKMYEGELT